MKYGSRINKLEKAISEIQFAEKGVRVIFQEHGQTEAQAMQAAGSKPDDTALTIFVRHFSEKPILGSMIRDENTAPKPEKTLQEIDAELAQLQSQLKEDIET